MHKLSKIAFVILLCSTLAPAYANDNGLIIKKSANSVDRTIDILATALQRKGIGVWARVDHQANGATVGEKLRPTTVLIFGNPKLGTPLMRSNQSIGVDLPMKVLAWEDGSGQVMIAYNDPAYLAQRHGITDQEEIIAKMSNALDSMTTMAGTKPAE